MERVKYQSHNEHITLRDLNDVENYMTLEEIREMKRRIDETTGCINIDGGAQAVAFAREMFRLGYLSSHVTRS